MSTTHTIPATPARLRSGSWGARAKGDAREGDTLQITTRAGKRWTATVAKVVWRGRDRDGSIVTLCATGSRGSARRGRRTGCSCGSREEYGEIIPSPHNCSHCQFEAVDM